MLCYFFSLSAPLILSGPENVKNTTGSDIAIMCEAKGFPVPAIEWTRTRVDGQTVYLPGISSLVDVCYISLKIF